jgi:hypothetical protein
MAPGIDGDAHRRFSPADEQLGGAADPERLRRLDGGP